MCLAKKGLGQNLVGHFSTSFHKCSVNATLFFSDSISGTAGCFQSGCLPITIRCGYSHKSAQNGFINIARPN